MSFLARTALRSRAPHTMRSSVQRRALHVENTVGNATPFKHDSKSWFGVKLTIFLLTGAGFPAMAAYFQLYVV
ncbi:hypothetical protein DFH11DRAFT_1727803 [Phellopilus nigrolimitatus]|nr:hypothetical protein DFH11DRAFT_1727803 [Phellopilus nigrolimitatus]